MAATTYMGLTLPVVSSTVGPTYASNINTALTSIDSHDHSSGKGIQVPTAGININADLSYAGFNATLLRSVRFNSQSSPLALTTDANCLSVSGGNLYYNNSSGQSVQITSGAALSASSLGGISGLSAPASAAYSSGTGTFTWQSTTNVAAIMDFGPLTTRDTANSALGITIKSPAGLGSAYSITLPAAVPGSAKLLVMGSSGALTLGDADGSTLQNSAGTLSVKAQGVSATQIANQTITATQIANNTITRTQQAAVGQQVSASSASASVTTSYADFTNLTVTITTTGRPVIVVLQPDGTNPISYGGSGTGAHNLNIRLVRAGSEIANWGANADPSTGGQLLIPTMTYVDPVGAGTYTYKLQGQTSAGSLSLFNAKLVAYEL